MVSFASTCTCSTDTSSACLRSAMRALSVLPDGSRSSSRRCVSSKALPQPRLAVHHKGLRPHPPGPCFPPAVSACFSNPMSPMCPRTRHIRRSRSTSGASRLPAVVGRPAGCGACYAIWMPTRSKRPRLNSARYLRGGLSGPCESDPALVSKRWRWVYSRYIAVWAGVCSG
jgi:hypothetical protein